MKTSRRFFGHSDGGLHDREMPRSRDLKKRVVFLEENPFSARDRGEWDTEYQVKDFVSDKGQTGLLKIRYKPVEVVAYFVESDRFPDGSPPNIKRESGWFVPDLLSGTTMFYVSKERFEELFEIIEDDK